MEIRLSEYTAPIKDEIFKNSTIIVDTNFSRHGESTLTFDSCSFQFENNGTLSLTSCIIKNSIFIGNEDANLYEPSKGEIRINGCREFCNNELKKHFRCFNAVDSLFYNFKDNSTITDYHFNNCEVSNFTIKGICRNLSFTNTFLKSDNEISLFDKRIIYQAICVKTIFDKVRVNPFYFSTKCHDKSSLDLTSSFLIDEWSRLRKKYAGLSLFIVFVLTFLFFLPLLTHSFFLLTLSKVDISLVNIKLTPLWEALLYGGKEGLQAILYAILTTILLLYNIGRLYMTITISKFREEEKFLKDANFQLVSIHPDKFKNQLIIDKILSVLFWISITYSLLKLTDTLMIAVPYF